MSTKCPYCGKKTSFWSPYSAKACLARPNDKNKDYYTPCCWRWIIKNEVYNIYKLLGYHLFSLKHFIFFRLPITINNYFFKSLCKLGKKLAIFQSKIEKRSYAIGGTIGWNLYIYFDRRIIKR